MHIPAQPFCIFQDFPMWVIYTGCNQEKSDMSLQICIQWKSSEQNFNTVVIIVVERNASFGIFKFFIRRYPVLVLCTPLIQSTVLTNAT